MDRNSISDGVPPLPDDLLAFINLYGSGVFTSDNLNLNLYLTVMNPYEEKYGKTQNQKLGILLELKEYNGADFIPYDVYPDRPGLLFWGFTDTRKDFLWLTEGEPNSWPVMVMVDVEIFTRFEMGMLQFLEQMLCGDLDCSFLGNTALPNNRYDPALIRFEPQLLRIF
jgi:hypothetical protein